MNSTTLFLIILLLFASCSEKVQSTDTYKTTISKTEKQRLNFQKAYQESKTSAQKDQVIDDARSYILKDIKNYFTAWSGTEWTFEEHTQTPRSGSIACGYFVTTVLRDMGFKIPRIKWAQLASESMILKMTSDVKRFRKAPMSDIIKYIQDSGEGLYIVGLDCHVGFIYYINNQMKFVHSNYYYPKKGVMAENLIGKNPLNDSRYRIIGKIFDEEMIKKWILGNNFTN